PDNPGATIRCALESLALLYRRTLRELEALLGAKIKRLHIVGGGSRNSLLNQFTASALAIPVHAGPIEATALGNVAVQAIALGHLPSIQAAREIIRSSSEIRIFHPRDVSDWNEQAVHFEALYSTDSQAS
ncbi:MAG: rhamnulokinase, partial [Verrucomicrobiota bacterium]